MKPHSVSFTCRVIALAVTFLATMPTYGAAVRPQISIAADRKSVNEGGSISITARVIPWNSLAIQESKPTHLLWPYVNGRQWGAPEETNHAGRASFLLPLPLAGLATIRVSTVGPKATPFPVGHRAPSGAEMSNTLTVKVHRRRFTAPRGRHHLVGIEYESWWRTWNLAEAIPLVGRYAPDNRMVIRQHALWFDQMGINYILSDWSFMLNTCPHHWNLNAVGVPNMIRSTDALFETYAKMRRDGIPTPKVVLMLGFNCHTFSTREINEQMKWIYTHYVTNPKFTGIWLYYKLKPLILILNGGGPSVLAGKPPIKQKEFTVRWVGAQLQNSPNIVKAGYWSWMDGSDPPIPTFSGGKCEALTVTPAYFDTPADWQLHGGWLGKLARPRENGVIYLRELMAAFQYRPHFLTICQWNEFATQATGHSYSPGHHIYQDCYSPARSNDIEPTSITARGYRGNGGWGFYYLNLTRAFVQIYRERQPQSGVLVIAPLSQAALESRQIKVHWGYIGKIPASFTMLLDGKPIAADIPSVARYYKLDLVGIAPGEHRIQLVANGVYSCLRISCRRVSRRMRAAPVSARQAFFMPPRGTHRTSFTGQNKSDLQRGHFVNLNKIRESRELGKQQFSQGYRQ